MYMYVYIPIIGPLLQGKALAWSVLPVQQVSRVAGRQAIRLQGWQDLLRQLLWHAVCVALRWLWRNFPRWWVLDNIKHFTCIIKKNAPWRPTKHILEISVIWHKVDLHKSAQYIFCEDVLKHISSRQERLYSIFVYR